MVEIAGGFLENVAADWYEDNTFAQGWKFAADEDDAETFVFKFINHFSTIEQQNKWHYELNDILQERDEKVESYSNRFKRLRKKVNPDSNLPGSYIIRLFLKGLKKDLMQYVTASKPADIDEAIQEAIDYEAGIYFEKQAERQERQVDRKVRAPTDDALEAMTKQMEKLTLNYT